MHCACGRETEERGQQEQCDLLYKYKQEQSSDSQQKRQQTNIFLHLKMVILLPKCSPSLIRLGFHIFHTATLIYMKNAFDLILSILSIIVLI